MSWLMRAYRLLVSIRRIFAVLVAIAVLAGPTYTHVSAAEAAVPDHHGQMTESGHCEAPPTDSSDDEAPTKSCCISICMAVASSPSTTAADGELKPVPRVFAVPELHPSYLGEIATPPPRRS